MNVISNTGLKKIFSLINSLFTSYQYKDTNIKYYSNENLFSSDLDNISNQYKNNTHYSKVYVLDFTPSFWTNGGGTWYLEGHKTNSLYEYQIVTTYYIGSIEPYRRFIRSKNNGVWNSWFEDPGLRNSRYVRYKYFGVYPVSTNIDELIKGIMKEQITTEDLYSFILGRFNAGNHYTFIANIIEVGGNRFGTLLLMSYHISLSYYIISEGKVQKLDIYSTLSNNMKEI